jgi:hypothetical protein
MNKIIFQGKWRDRECHFIPETSHKDRNDATRRVYLNNAEKGFGDGYWNGMSTRLKKEGHPSAADADRRVG